MVRSQRKQKMAGPCQGPQMDRLFQLLIQGVESPDLLAELCYMSREPELLEALRMFAAMTPASQAAVMAFFAIAGKAESIAAKMDGGGTLTLTSPHIGEALAEVINAHETRRIEIEPDRTSRIH
jgi:hypothetical protein